MASYIYKKKFKKRVHPMRRMMGFVFLLSATAVGLYFFFPVISFNLYLTSVFASTDLTTPLPSDLLANSISTFSTDYEDARNWYPKVQTKNEKTTIKSYTLSIPKLEIDDAVVSTVNYNLAQNLVQYWETSNPGEKGTTVIVGHSTLPQMYSPGNYRTIFANLHRLKTGDEVHLKVGESTFTYKVYGSFITEPDDTAIFAQNSDNSYLTIVTCTPPGTVWKRLIVRAKLFEAIH